MRKVSNQWLREVLDMLYQRRTATRGEIIRATGLNAASASHALQYLIDRAVVLKMGALHSTGGRRRDVLKLNAEVGYFVAADLEGTRIRFALTNLVGDILHRWAEDIEIGSQLKTSQVAYGVEMVLRNLDAAERSRVIAVGISHPGASDRAGRVTAVNFGWQKLPLVAHLQKGINLPIFIERAGPNCILAERALGVAKNCDNCVYVIFGIGVGIGAFVHGKLLSGNNGMAGELGHVMIDPSAEDHCNCGKKGCLEAIVSSPNIVRQYLAKTGRSGKQAAALPVTEVFERARQGDSSALAVIDRVVACLGLALSHLVNLLNPELIVLGGDIFYGEDLLLLRLKEQVSLHVSPASLEGFKIKLSSLGLDIGLKGAASLAFKHSILDPTVLRKLCRPPLPDMHVSELRLLVGQEERL